MTAFTIGHSVSLGLAFFDLLRLPGPPTEALIALSIALVAREGLLAGPGGRAGSGSSMRVGVVVTIFGLVHGLGFATALRELGVADGERWPALVLAAGRLLERPTAAAVRRWALYASGIVGCFWVVERVTSLGWT